MFSVLAPFMIGRSYRQAVRTQNPQRSSFTHRSFRVYKIHFKRKG